MNATRPGDNSHHSHAANNATSTSTISKAKSAIRNSKFEIRGPKSEIRWRLIAIFIAIALVATVVCVRAFRVEASSAPAGAASNVRIRWASPSFDRLMSNSRISGPLAAYLLPMPAVGTCDGGSNVDVESTGGTALAGYSTVKLAFDAINAGTHTGTIIIEVCSNTTEGTTPATLNSSGAGSASYTSINMYPIADGVSISGNPITGFGVIQLNGADNFTINGDNPNTAGTNRNLTVANTAIATVIANSAVRIATSAAVLSADNDTIKNCILNGNVTGGNLSTITSTSGSSNSSFGIYVGGNGGATATTAPTAITSVTANTAPSGTTVNSLTIDNNAVNQCARAIVFNGAASTVSTGVTISNNTIGTAGANAGTPPFTSPTTTVYTKAIWLSGLNAASVTGNTIQNILSYVATTMTAIETVSPIGSGAMTITGNTITTLVNNAASAVSAITLPTGSGTFNISSNIITSVQAVGSSAAAISVSTTAPSGTIALNKITTVRSRSTGGVNARGIAVLGGNAVTIQNNFIAEVLNIGSASFGTSFNANGILLNAGNNHKVYHNTVNLFGVSTSVGSNSINCLAIQLSTQTGIDVRNNIFSNTVTGGAATDAHVGVFLPFAASGTMLLTLNNNAYYTGTIAGTSGVAFAGAAAYAAANVYSAANFNPALTTPATNFRSFSSALGVATNDNASFAATTAAPFVSATDLHLTGGAPVDAGATIGTVTNDIDLQVRPNPNTSLYDMGADEFYATPGTVEFSATSYTGLEGELKVITVNRVGGSSGAISVNYATGGGSATGGAACTAGVDYISASGTLNWGNTITTPQTFNVQLCNDAVIDTELVQLTLSSPVGTTISGTNPVNLNITDNPPGTIQFSSVTYNGDEGTLATITATRTGGTGGAVQVDYATGGGSATGGAACGGAVDYIATNNTLMWANNDGANKTFTVTLCADANISEGPETVGLTLSNVLGGATIGANNPATLTINDVGTTTCNADGVITIPPTSGTPPFASTPYPSNVVVSGLVGTTNTVKVTLNTITHTFGNDIDILLVSPTGQKFILMSDVGDSSGLDAAVTLTFKDGGAVIPTTGPIPTGTYAPTDITSGDVFATGAPAGPYVSPAPVGAGTLNGTFGGLNPNGTWQLFVSDDANGDGGTIASWCIEITTTIAPGNIQLSSTTYSGTEGGTVAATANRVAGSNGTVGATYTLTDGTAVGGAACTAGVDYINPGPQLLSFGDTVTSQPITVTLCTDAAFDPGETFTITLSAPTGGAGLGSPTVATATIADVAPPFSSNVNVGAGQNYTSLTNPGGIFEAINNSGVTGSFTINITSNLTSETGAVALNAFASPFTITIKPDTSIKTISGPAASTALIRLNGASRVTIDGSTSGGSDRSLTIENTSTTAPQVVRFGSIGTTPIVNDTLKNCVIRNGVNTSSAVTLLDTAGTLAGYFNNITIQNNDIQKAYIGTFNFAIVSAGNGSGLSITQNKLDNSGANAIRDVGIYVQGADGATVSQNTVGNLSNTEDENDIGIWLATGTVNSTVSGNTVSNLGYTGIGSFAPVGILDTSGVAATANNLTGNNVSNITSNGSAAVRGMVISASGGTTIQKNNVQGILNTSTSTYGAYGMDISGGNNNVVKNNFVSNVKHDMTGGAAFSTTFGVFGIRVGSGSNILVYHNSVNLYGTYTGTAASSLLSAAFALVGTGSQNCDVRNNIFANTLSSGTTSIAHVSVYLPSGGTSLMNLTWNNNAYYNGTDAARQGLAQVGTTAGTGFYLTSNFNAAATTPATNFRAYSSTLSVAGTNDNASLAATTAAPFTSTNDLHILRSGPAYLATAVENVGAPIGSVTNDFDADTRDASTPDIGADEVMSVSFSQTTYRPEVSGTNEGDTAVITVNRTSGAGAAATVNFTVGGGSATGGAACTAGVDYITPASLTLNFAAADTSKTFNIVTCADGVYEGNETVPLTLASVSGDAIIGTPNTATVNIIDGQTQPTATIGNVTQNELDSGTSTFSFLVTLSGPSATATTINYTTADVTATAGSDYVGVPSGSIIIPATQTTGNILITVNGDTTFEANETFTVTITSPDVLIGGGGVGTGTITNDDTAPTFAIGDVTQVETDSGTTNFVFTVTKTGSTALDSVITYSTNDGTATSPSDFTAVTGGTITILAAAPSGPITISVNGDTDYEANETFTVDGTNVTNGTFSDASGLGTITNDDAIPATLVVNSTNDPGTGICDLAECTLREAIILANANADTTTINFAIPGGGVKTISPTSALPTITTPVVIDGYSQTGSSVNTQAASDNAVLLIELDGTSAGAISNGLNISGGPSTIKGLVVNRFGGVVSGFGIACHSNGHTISGNFVGTDPTGLIARPNGNSGVFVNNGVSGNLIGGTTLADRNLISGSGFDGIDINGPGNTVQNNFIGVDKTGATALANSRYGVSVASGNTIGGTTANTRNVISGNTNDGILISGASTNTIQGNYIGTNAAGTAGIANGAFGIEINSGSSGNIIGGVAAGEANVIAFNGNDGVEVDSGTGNAIRGNSIHDNGTTIAHLGIDLSPDGVTANDVMDPDTGANNLQNFPVITGATVTGSTRIITGSLNSTAVQLFTIDFYNNTTCDLSTNGEGKTYLGSIPVTTDSSGNKFFTFNPATLSPGDIITATATDALGNTSEFSQCKPVAAGTAGEIKFVSATYSVAENGGLASITVQRTGGSNGSISATFNTSDGTATDADNDYEPVTGFPFSYADGETGIKTVNITINDDATYEANETVNLSLSATTVNRPSGPKAPVGDSAVLTITNDDNPPATLVVNTTADPGTGVCDVAECTLREAITAANSVGDANTVNFNIPAGMISGGVFTIQPTSQLPFITSPVNIDGTTQTAFTSDTNVFGPEVVINGSLTSGANGITISASNSTVKGLVVNGFQNGISIGGGVSNGQILDNYVGTDATGTTAVPNADSGVSVATATGCTVSGNLISGTSGLPTTGFGIATCDVSNTTFSNNKIGTDRTGTLNLGNSGEGMHTFCTSFADNTISGNTFAFNGRDGFRDEPDYRFGSNHLRTKITQNSFFENTGLGINLLPPPFGTIDGVTPNDPQDPDTGSNNLQNFPQLLSASVTGSTKTITGVLNTTPATTGYVIEFFNNAACDGSGNGEGKTYLGSVTTGITDGSGNVFFTFNPATLSPGDIVTATATDSNGNTSEFSQCKPVGAGSPGDIQFTSPTYTVGEAGPTAAITVDRVGGSDGAITANFSTSNGSAIEPGDYTAVTSFPISYADGETGPKTVFVTINDDGTYEGDETVNLTLGTTTVLRPQHGNDPPPVFLDPHAATLTITDNDTAPTFSIDDVTHVEGNPPGTTSYVFTVTKTGATALSSSVDFITQDGSATLADNDYQSNTGTVSFTDVQTTQQITVLVNRDTNIEPDEDFKVHLQNPSGATIVDADGTGTITNDDSALSFAIDDVTQAEGTGAGTTAFTFTVTKTGSAGTSSVQFTTQDGSATQPSDYTLNSGTLNFGATDTSMPITVLVNKDADFEGDETFNVHLSNPVSATISDADGTGTITNDDTCGVFATVYVDDDWVGTAPGADPDGVGPATSFGCDSFATIQGGVNGVSSGGAVIVRAGTYPEAVLINKPLSLQGAKVGQNANTRFAAFTGGPANPKANPAVESVITAALTAPTSAANDTLHVMASNVTIDGFVVDGNNPLLTPTGATVIGGINTDSRRAIQTEDAAGAVNFPANNVTVQNNVIQNFAQRGVELVNGASSAAPATSGSLITGNVVRVFGLDGIVLAFNAHADITNNTVVTPDYPTEAGIWVQDFLNTGTPIPITIANNNVTVGQDNFGGIWANLAYLPSFNINNNTVNAAAGVVSGDDFTYGIYVTSLRPGSSVGLNGNIVGSSGGTFDRGIALWNLGTGQTTTVTGGTVGHAVDGVSLHDNDPNFGLAGSNSAVDLSGVTISGTTVGVLVDALGSTGDTVAMQISGNTSISGGSTGISVTGANASANIHNNAASIHDNGVGINVAAGSATITSNNLYANGTGLRFTSGATATAHFNRIISTTTAIDNANNLTLNLENNWWGCNAGPGNTGCGAVTGTGADFDPWIVLGVSAVPSSIGPGQNSTVTADMTKNSAGATPVGTLPDMAIAWTATNGTMSPTSGTVTAGTATSTFTSSNSSSGTACGMVDNQNTCTPVTVTLPSFSIDDVTHLEGNGGPGTTAYLFTITKTGAGAASVDYATVDGTATAPSDYTAIPTTTVSFLTADTTKQFTVLVNGDTVFEGNEAFTVHLSNAVGATISDADGTGTITNDDACGAFATVYVDDSWVGTPLGSDPDGVGPATSFGCDSFATIQEGIDAVTTGGTVIVYAGTYTQAGSINLNKSLVLQGPNSAISPNGGARVAEAVITGAASTVLRISSPGSPVTIDGFKFDNAGVVDAYDPALNITIRKNIYSNGISGGAFYFLNAPTQLTLDDNRLTNAVLADNDAVFVAGNWNGTTGTVATITNNVIENTPADSSTGMNLSSVSGTISGNQFTKLRYYAILLANDSSSMTVSSNVFDGIVNPDPTNVPTWGAGVRFYTPAFTGPVNIKSNTFKNSYVGVGVRATGGNLTGMDIHVNFNRFVGNTFGIRHDGTGPLEAQNNWWGCNAGPGGSGCDTVSEAGAGNTDFNPWIVLGVSAVPSSIGTGQNSTVTADMTKNSDGATPVGGTVPPMPVAWSATNGTMSPTAGTITAGQAMSTFTPNSSSSGTACAMVDNQQICTPITVSSPSFSIDDVTHLEGDPPGTTSYVFTVTKTGSTGLSSSVNFTTQDGSATLADNDYQTNSGPLNFGPTDTTMQITVLVNRDTNFEPNEAFNVHLSGAINATISDADGTGTITNDDTPGISGHVAYDDSVTTFGKNVTMTLTGNNGFVTRTTTTDANGDYSFVNVPSGNDYTLTPSKVGDVGALHVESADASKAARFVAGLDIPTATQIIASDADGDGILTSFDAALIARYAAGLPNFGIVGTWKFVPVNRSYSSLATNQSAQNFTAILVGDTDGNWQPALPSGGGDGNGAVGISSPQSPDAPGVTVSLPNVSGAMGSTISVPITVGNLTGQAVKAYDLQVSFNAAIVQPAGTPFDTTGTISSGMLITPNAMNSGHLIISAFQTTDLSGAGTLINLRFTIVGTPGQVTPTTFADYTDPGTIFHPGFRFNAGTPAAITTNGSIHVNGPTATAGSVSGRVTDETGRPVSGVVITLNGTQSRRTITDADGNYRFDEVETGGFYTVTPSRANFGFSPGQRSFSQVGNTTDAVFTAVSNGNNANPLDMTEYFVRQQYLDFLGREPDEAGFNYWVNNIAACGADSNCLAAKRTDTSAAFFLSTEFEQTGYLVYRMYQSAYGDRPGTPVPLELGEFQPDTRVVGQGVVVNQTGWEAKLEANKQAFASEFVARARFTSAYPTTMSPTEFVERLFQNGGVTPNGSDLAAAINEFGGMADTANAAARARAVRRVAENATLRQQEYNQAFVLMQYFGYLGRDPNTRPDTDFSGYNFWLNKLDSFNGDFRKAEMVKAFLLAGEYRGRFPR